MRKCSSQCLAVGIAHESHRERIGEAPFPGSNRQPSGVGLRISRESPAAGLLGNNDWREISHSVVVPPGGRQIELICEFRAGAGEAWFDADSLRMIRQR